MDRPPRAPWSPALKVAAPTAGACTALLLLCLDPRGQYDRGLANLCAVALALAALSWVAVLGVWLRDSALARHAEQRRIARAELADTRRAVLAEVAGLRDDMARHDRQVRGLVEALTEAIAGYGDDRQTAALVSMLGAPPNGAGVDGGGRGPSLRSIR